jgi:hypothetical protein
VDRHALEVPPTTEPGEYEVEVGLYGESMRLTTADGSNYIVVGRLRKDGDGLTLLPNGR